MVFAGKTAHEIQISPRFYANRCTRFLCIALMAACVSAGVVIWPGEAHAGTNATIASCSCHMAREPSRGSDECPGATAFQCSAG